MGTCFSPRTNPGFRIVRNEIIQVKKKRPLDALSALKGIEDFFPKKEEVGLGGCLVEINKYIAGAALTSPGNIKHSLEERNSAN